MSPKGDLLMILDTESWMNIRRFRALHAAGATFVEIGRDCGCDCRTVRKLSGRGRALSRRRHRLERAPMTTSKRRCKPRTGLLVPISQFGGDAGPGDGENILTRW